jgi:hypothetical protein
MILVRDVHVMACPHIVTNGDGEVTNDAASFSNEATISDLYNGTC